MLSCIFLRLVVGAIVSKPSEFFMWHFIFFNVFEVGRLRTIELWTILLPCSFQIFHVSVWGLTHLMDGRLFCFYVRIFLKEQYSLDNMLWDFKPLWNTKYFFSWILTQYQVCWSLMVLLSLRDL